MFLDIVDIKFLFDEIERLKKENEHLSYELQEIKEVFEKLKGRW